MATVFALLGDVALLVLGADLKRKEKLTARLSDTLGYLVLTMSVIRHFADQNTPEEDLPLLDWACRKNLYLAQESIWSFLENFPVRSPALALRLTIFPFGRRLKYPDDRLGKQVAALITHPSEARDRLTRGCLRRSMRKTFIQGKPCRCWTVFSFSVSRPIIQKKNCIRRISRELSAMTTGAARIREAARKNLISMEEAQDLLELEQLHQQIISVDDFADLKEENTV